MERRDRIQRTHEDVFAAWNAHDPDGLVKSYADGAEIVDVTSGVVTTGRDSLRAVAASRLDGFPDFSLAQQMIVIDGDSSADRWVMRGTHIGDYHGLEPTGRKVEISGATFTEYNDRGLILRENHYLDIPALFRQLGVS